MLDFWNVSASYGEKTVLNNASFSLEKGKIVSLIGVNGCGKSTLLKTIVGIVKPKTGEIGVDGESVLSMNPQKLATRIAYLPQGRTAPDMTAGQLVLHGRFPHLSFPRRYTPRDREITREVMSRMGISSFSPKPLSELSGGMRQTVYIAMALAQGSDYILLDEPTTHLDISRQIELMRQLRSVAEEGKGVLAVMHDLALAFSFSDEILLLDNGQIVLSGAPEHIFSSPLIEQIFGVKLCAHADGKRYFCLY